MEYEPTSQLSPVPILAKSVVSYPRNCEPTRRKPATKKDKNSLSSPPPKVIFPPSHACDDKKKDKERARPTNPGRKEGVSGASQERKDDHTNHIL